MKLVSNKFKFVLITIPKNGCVTFRYWFDYNERGKLKEFEALTKRPKGNIHEHCKKNYLNKPIRADYKKFAIIRNPWTRLASAYFDKIDRSKWLKELNINSITDFILFLSLINVDSKLTDEHWRSQHVSIKNLKIDQFLQVETLQQDANKMAETLGIQKIVLPNWKQSAKTNNRYKNVYSKEEAKLIEKLYLKDTMLAHYKCPEFMIDETKIVSLRPSLHFRMQVYNYVLRLKTKYYKMRIRQVLSKMKSIATDIF